MRPGTPGFDGARLAQAREARGLTVTALAERLELKPQNISQYEHGKQTPSPEVMGRICGELKLPNGFFTHPVHNSESDRIFYRSLVSATKAARVSAERRFEWLKEITAYLKEYFDFPELNLPGFKVPRGVGEIDSDLIEHLAEDCRRFWGLGSGPISDVVQLLENNGVVVSRTPLGAEKLDAFSQWCGEDESPYIVLSADKGSAARSRFDAAHELGHLVLHADLSDAEIAEEHSMIEDQAHRFAAAFLLPARSFQRELVRPTLDGFLTLKWTWKVSIGMMIQRAQHLGMLRGDQVTRAWINLSRRGWRQEEPLDNRLPVERPMLLRRCIEVLVQEGHRSADQILADLRLPASDVEELCGLPDDFFRESSERAFPRPKPRLVRQDRDTRSRSRTEEEDSESF